MDKTKIDIGSIFSLIKARKRFFLKTMGIAFIAGLVIAFSIPKAYTTTIQLAPESGKSGLGSDLSSLASMVGVSLGGKESSDAFYPKIYPNILASNDFVIPLWDMQVKTIDGSLSTTLYDYLLLHQKSPWWQKGIDWVSSLVGSITGSNDNNQPATGASSQEVNPFHLNKQQDAVAGAIKGMVKCNVDQKTDVITLAVTAQDPLVAATVADSVQYALLRYITDYRTTKARQDLEFMEKLFDEARTEYEQARQRYTSYADSNNELVLESYKAKQEDLENTMQLRYNIYSQMAQRLELAKAKVQEETPAFTVIQSATVPLQKSKPKRMTLVLGLMILTFIGSVLWAMNHQPKEKVESAKAKDGDEEETPMDIEERPESENEMQSPTGKSL